MNAFDNTTQNFPSLSKVETFLHENITWKRLLDFFIQENNFLKTRLSEVVDRETDKTFIAHAEQFQNDFLLKEECIRDIGSDIKEQEKNLQFSFKHKVPPDHKTCKKQEKLRNEMSYLEKECTNLKHAFNKYLLTYHG
ncbi:MAG: hypothetical protein JWP81_3223 [Ferruginibacter sp.]|nr:hypothetical protein [Ferruginibacter sp.]